MYEVPLDEERLRQGDVIQNFHFPRYSFATLRLLHTVEDDGSTAFSNEAKLGAQVRHGVVVSQCCEFTSGKRNAFSLAALSRIPDLLKPQLEVGGFNVAELVPVAHSTYRGKGEVSDEQIERLREANEVDWEADRNDAVNVYLYEPDGEVLDEPYLVDFTRITSVRMKDQDRVLESKVLELDDEHRREFQVKLGYYYARRAE